jgi:hypothetical protein
LTPAKEWEGAKDHMLCVFCEGFLPDAPGSFSFRRIVDRRYERSHKTF